MNTPTPYEPNPYHVGGTVLPPSKPKKKRAWLKVLLVILAIIVIAVAALFVWGWRTSNDMLKTADEACREDVAGYAKYPGGITWVDEPADTYTTVTNNRDNRVYVMNGEVDFPNAFGTPKRGTYACLAEFGSDYEMLKHVATVNGIDD